MKIKSKRLCAYDTEPFIFTRAETAGAKTDNVQENPIRFLSSCQALAQKGAGAKAFKCLAPIKALLAEVVTTLFLTGGITK